jgi:rfaE bifunctional protein kinase chain/domain
VKEKRLLELLDRLRNIRAAVLGDVCLDAYWYADMKRSELSRETPHHNRPVYRETYSGGALANVASNLSSLGIGQITVLTILGQDWRGDILKRLLERQNFDTSKIIFAKNRLTPMFLKPILQGHESTQEAPRYDFFNEHPPKSELAQSLAQSLKASLNDFDCVLLGDQIRDGVMNRDLIESVVEMAGNKERAVFTVDSRYRIARFANMVWKPNEIEAADAIGVPAIPDNPAAREEAAKNLLNMGAGMVFMTVGKDGCFAADRTATFHVPAVSVPPPLEIVGAGDTFHAAIAAFLAAGATTQEAAYMGNLAASVTVAKIGSTGTASPQEILSRYRESKFSKDSA